MSIFGDIMSAILGGSASAAPQGAGGAHQWDFESSRSNGG
jgi:hypothetical protein